MDVELFLIRERAPGTGFKFRDFFFDGRGGMLHIGFAGAGKIILFTFVL